jgi:hypothetical protein
MKRTIKPYESAIFIVNFIKLDAQYLMNLCLKEHIFFKFVIVLGVGKFVSSYFMHVHLVHKQTGK